jgi:signal transduction histidine kinase
VARRLPRALVRRSWWWLFGLFIGTPAVALALLGLGAIRADERERQRQHRDQQAQVASQILRLADAALTTTINGVEADTRRTPAAIDSVAGSETAVAFEIDPRGTVSFPAVRVYVAAAGAAVTGDAPSLTSRARVAIERAQAAELRGTRPEAVAWYERIRAIPAIRAWAEWRLFLQSDPSGRAMAEHIRTRGLTRSDDRSPGGVPLAMLAVSELADRMPEGRAHAIPLAAEVLASLLNGRWWTSVAQRRVYASELRQVLAGGPDDVPVAADDEWLDVSEHFASAIREAFDAHERRPPRLTAAGRTDERLLIAWTHPTKPTGAWSGVALPDVLARRRLDAALGPLLDGQSFRGTLRHGGDVVWSNQTSDATVVALSTPQPLDSAPGWTMTLDDTAIVSSVESHQALNYARVIFPIVVLACGLIMTAWIVRRELALTALQSTFVSAVTHEFKSPLTSIRLLTERLASGRLPDDGSPARYHAAIAAETDRLEGLVNRLLESQKLQSGRREFTFQPAMLEVIAREAIERMRPQADAKAIQLDLDVADTPPLALDVDAIADTIRNLIDNAIKYSPAHSRVVLSIASDGHDVALTVADEGVGVDPAEVDRLFDPFYRSRRGDRANVHGTGLGLSLVRATAEAHGGRVSAAANGARGSRFTVWLPIAPAGSRVVAKTGSAGTSGPALRRAPEGRS